jgi:ABC-2 type transport system permease protein
VSRPAPALAAVAALATAELRLTARRGENVLVTLAIPVAVLLFFAGTAMVPGIGEEPVDYLLPGAIALAIIASGLVSLGIATAYERSYGVLKRLGGAPIPRWGLVGAKVAAVLVFEAVQVAALVLVATLALGWSPGPGWSPILLAMALLLGTLAFAGLGLLIAGTLRAEATLALANGLFLGFLMLGGIVLPIDQLPAFVRPVAALLPAGALQELLRVALASGIEPGAAMAPTGPAVILLAWGSAASGLAIRTFRWE